MTETFQASDEVKAAWPTATAAIEQAAFDMVDDFLSMKMGNREATSLVAHLLVRAAWTVAGTGRISVGETPDPSAFIGVATQATEDITWPQFSTVETEQVAVKNHDCMYDAYDSDY